MIKTILTYFILLFTTFVLFNCGHIESLPTVSEAEQSDTAYVHIFPDWEKDEFGFNTPKDVLVGDDGYIFIADSGNSRIVVLDQAGVVVTDDEFGNNFQDLGEIKVPGKENIEPLQLSQDSKMNLLFIDGSNQVYAWNQYYNNAGIRYVSKEVILYNSDLDQYLHSDRMDSLSYYLGNGYTLYDAIVDSSEELINSILAPHVIFDGNDPKNYEFVDDYGDTRNSKIVDIAVFGGDYSNLLYIMDKRYDRIVKLKYVIKQLLIMGTDSSLSVAFDYECIFSEVATSKGFGAGFVMEPTSIATDISGNIYFTQTGGVYPSHGISAGSYRTLFDPLDEDDILDTERFPFARNIGVDFRGIIYVVDAINNIVQAFDSKGTFQRNIGTTLVDSDSSAVIEVADILSNPEAIFIDENIVYIADTGNSRIVRFQYSILTQQNLQRW